MPRPEPIKWFGETLKDTIVPGGERASIRISVPDQAIRAARICGNCPLYQNAETFIIPDAEGVVVCSGIVPDPQGEKGTAQVGFATRATYLNAVLAPDHGVIDPQVKMAARCSMEPGKVLKTVGKVQF